MGWFRRVHVKARRTMELRTLLTSRKTLVLKIGDLENQVRGSLHLFGINLGAAKRRSFGERVRELTAGLPIVLDLIDVNDPTGRYRPPSAEELNTFRDALTAELGMPVVRRYSGGQDIAGGCGMLAGKRVG